MNNKTSSTVPPFVYAASHLGEAVLLLRRMMRLPRYAKLSRKLAALASVLEKFIAEIERMAE
jgi:hypothetical protein